MKSIPITGHRRTYINLKKAKWNRYTQEIEDALSKIPPPTDCQKHENIFRPVLIKAASHQIPQDDTDSVTNLCRERSEMSRTSKTTFVSKIPPHSRRHHCVGLRSAATCINDYLEDITAFLVENLMLLSAPKSTVTLFFA